MSVLITSLGPASACWIVVAFFGALVSFEPSVRGSKDIYPSSSVYEYTHVWKMWKVPPF
jgi:hypothetical protein